MSATGAPADSYAAAIDGLPGGPPLAHWRLGEAGGARITDRAAGTRHGMYSGLIGFGAQGLPQNSDNAVNFGGKGSGQINHDAGLELAAFTLSFWFKMNALPDGRDPAGGDRFALIARDETGNTPGDFAVLVEDDGSLTIGYQPGGGGAREILPELPTVDVGEAHHLVVRSDSSGFDAYLDGIYLGKNAAFTDAWSGNRHPIRFASVPWLEETADCHLDEVALYPRVLDEAEVLTLAQISAAPVAADDAVNVPGGTMRVIDVTANDTFVGAKADLTVKIESQPAPDRAKVNENNDIEYKAGPVDADTERSFTYRIVDPKGTSNTATVNVTVRDPSAPRAGRANCYVESDAGAVVVKSMDELEAKVNAAPAGSLILIAPGPDGPYPGGTRTFKRAGTAAKPIVIRSQKGIDTVKINDATWTLNGAHLVFSRLHFNNSTIIVNGDHQRITRCRFKQVKRYCIEVRNADDTRIDHCDVSDWVDDKTKKGFVRIDTGSFVAGGHRNVLCDYNYLHDVSHATRKNGSCFLETTSGKNAWRTNTGLVFDHNLIENCKQLPDGEFLQCKHSGMKIRFNTFIDVDGYLQQRQGGGWEVRSNWFEKMGNDSPLKCWDDFEAGERSGAGRALVIGNRLVGHSMWIGAGTSAAAGPSFYHASKEGRYIGNKVDGKIVVGAMFDKQKPPLVKAQRNNLWDNIGRPETEHADDPPSSRENEPFTSADNPLTKDDVGVDAPDPLCDG